MSCLRRAISETARDRTTTSDRTRGGAGALSEVLGRAREIGLLGPPPIADQLCHAASFVAGLEGLLPGLPVLDLGSGGGLPGLVIAASSADHEVVLLDSRRRAVEFLRWAVTTLGLGDRTRVLADRAENAGRSPEHRGTYGAVVARSFGPPAVTAECAAPFLVTGGMLLVSEPPADSARIDRDTIDDFRALRWPASGLRELGLVLGLDLEHPSKLARLYQDQPCPDRFPRAVGVAARRPLFGSAGGSVR